MGLGRIKGGVGTALLAAALLAGVSGCGGDAKASSSGGGASAQAAGASASAGASGSSASASAKPSPTHPSGPPMLLDSITPGKDSTVGVAMPISVVFSNAVATSARANIEKHLKVYSSTPVTGAWHWFSATRVDFRPENYWQPGTKVRIVADMTDVPDGNGRYGTKTYTHDFTIGDDISATVSVKGHTMKVYKGGSLLRTLKIDAGSPDFPSWDGTMAVIGKAPEVRMTSCSVGITCDKSNPNFYDLTLPWDVQLTYSGTYVHYSTGDPYPGHSYGSHGCVHLSLADAKWFYNLVKQGDPITITGSPRGKAAADNGYAAYDDTWSKWLSNSSAGAVTTSALS